jgi:eukaryotic-like serine/threonine-protein kinase
VRLPAHGGPDDALPTTGRRPRTELTHQVPGRHRRPAPVIAEPARGIAAWRTASVRKAVVGVLGVAALALAGWGGARALGLGTAEAVEPTVVAASSALPESTAPEPPAAAADVPSAADMHGIPASAEQWRVVVADLYARRADAFAGPSAADLASVYTRISPLRAADEEHARGLTSAGEALRGFAPEVVAVNGIDVSGDRVELDLVDRWPAYEVVAADDADGPALRTSPARADAAVRLVLVRTADGWRIDSAERLG